MHLSQQEMFNLAIAGLAAQDFEPSVNGSNHCVYRAADGRKCALGHLIPDAFYDPKMEQEGVYNLFTNFPATMKGLFRIEDRPFLAALQGAHDVCADPDWRRSMQQELRDVAAEFALDLPEELKD